MADQSMTLFSDKPCFQEFKPAKDVDQFLSGHGCSTHPEPTRSRIVRAAQLRIVHGNHGAFCSHREANKPKEPVARQPDYLFRTPRTIRKRRVRRDLMS
jgi:hypothetical protein